MTKQVDKVLSSVLSKICPSPDELSSMKSMLNETLKKLRSEVKKQKVIAQVFVGGSFAKGTVTKKNEYDADIFIRFDKSYEQKDLPKMLSKILKKIVKPKNIINVHGSRDYFKIKMSDLFFIELIPVRKVNKPEGAENITDLSYSHVKYINKKAESQKVLDNIKIAKAFCHACSCYGAESYISGFSGYSLELLICKYSSFEKFLKAMVKIKAQEIIDIEHHYKNKQAVMLDLNESKLLSPVVLIDPTFKQRNALAALSNETFERFQKAASKFLKTPNEKSFEVKKVDLERIKALAIKAKYEFVLIEAVTEKQEGDIAGSKLLKFYKQVASEVSKFYSIKKQGFNYNKEQAGRFFFVVKNRGDVVFSGPMKKDLKNVKKFKKKHARTFEKKGQLFAKVQFKLKISDFVNQWSKKNSSKIKEMYVSGIKVISN